MKLFDKVFKKEKTEIESKLSELKKTLYKDDEISIQASLDVLKELSENNQEIIKNKFEKISEKPSLFMSNLAKLFLRVETTMFTTEIVQIVIDYCFRFGSAKTQKTGVMILAKYVGVEELFDRYKLVYLKDKKANEYLKAKIYNK